MAVTITPPLATPSNVVATLQDGGTLLANTTYYVRVTARSIDSYAWTASPGNPVTVSSSPSVEISFTTDTVKKSALITWNAISGAAGKIVYISTISGNYIGANHKCGIYNSTCSVSTPNQYLISAMPTNAYGMDAFSSFLSTDFLPQKIDKELGNISINLTGTNTLQTIYDAIVAQGFGAYAYYDGKTFVCKGGLSIYGSSTGQLIETNKTIIFAQGGITNANSNFLVQFGTYNLGNAYGGCVIYDGYESQVNLEKIKFYACYISAQLVPYAIYGWQGYSYLGLAQTDINRDMKGCLAENLAFRGGTKPPCYLTVNSGGYTNWVGESIGVIQTEGLLYFLGDRPYFRDWDHNITNGSHPAQYGCHYLTWYTALSSKVYDSIFRVAGIITTNNLPYVYYEEGLNRPFEIYNSITLKIVDKNGVGVSGATIQLKDKNNAVALSTTTDVNGLTTKADILRATINWAGSGTGQVNVLLSPFTLTITKAGYQTYTDTFNITDKINWEIALELDALKISSLSQSHCTLPGVSDGTITIQATGGTQPYQYSIDNGATWQDTGVYTGLAPGNYQVKVKDADNKITDAFGVEIVSPAVDTTYAAVITGKIEQITLKGEMSQPISGEITTQELSGRIVVITVDGNTTPEQLTGNI